MGWFVACWSWRKTGEIQIPVPWTWDVFLHVGQCVLPKIEPSGATNPVHMSLFRNVPSDGPYIYDIFRFVKFYSDADAWQNLREMFPIFLGGGRIILCWSCTSWNVEVDFNSGKGPSRLNSLSCLGTFSFLLGFYSDCQWSKWLHVNAAGPPNTLLSRMPSIQEVVGRDGGIKRGLSS